MIAIGPEWFRRDAGGFFMRWMCHFRTTPPEKNLPVLLGLLGIWYTEFFDDTDAGSLAV